MLEAAGGIGKTGGARAYGDLQRQLKNGERREECSLILGRYVQFTFNRHLKQITSEQPGRKK